MSFRFFITLFLIVNMYNSYAQPEIQKEKQLKINDELFYNQVTDDVYMITHYFPYYGGNSLVIKINDQAAVLIDTPYDGVATSALLKWIYNEFGQLKLYAIVTGYHQDNLGGNEILIQNNIPVYGMQLTADLVVNDGDELISTIKESVKDNENKMFYSRYSNLNLTPPDQTFNLEKGNGKMIEIENKVFEFFYPGASHTTDNAVVYIHEKQLLFGGCMIRALRDTRPGYIKYANMEAWPNSVKLVKTHFPKSKIVIPGHGLEGGIELLQHTVDILDTWNANNK